MKYDPSISGTLSGSIGGLTFSSNGSAQLKPRQPNRISVSRSASRASFASLSNLWRSLTSEQQSTWINTTPQSPRIDRLGRTHLLSGFNLFCSLNRLLISFAQAPILSAPTPPNIPAVQALPSDLSLSGGTFPLGFSISAPSADILILQSYSPPMSPGRTRAYKSDFRFFGPFPSGTPSSSNAYASYIARFPLTTANIGARIFKRMQSISFSTGYRLAPSFATCRVVA